MIDGSKRIDEDQVREWTMFTLTQVYQYHKHSSSLRNSVTGSDYYQDDTESINARSVTLGGGGVVKNAGQTNYQEQH